MGSQLKKSNRLQKRKKDRRLYFRLERKDGLIISIEVDPHQNTIQFIEGIAKEPMIAPLSGSLAGIYETLCRIRADAMKAKKLEAEQQVGAPNPEPTSLEEPGVEPAKPVEEEL